LEDKIMSKRNHPKRDTKITISTPKKAYLLQNTLVYPFLSEKKVENA